MAEAALLGSAQCGFESHRPHHTPPRAAPPGNGGGRLASCAVKLSVLVPVYNEAKTLQTALKRILDVDYPCEVEVVLVDDGSTDGTREMLDAVSDPRAQVVHHPANRGKGAAIRTAAEAATGNYMIICDADLEYAPEEIPSLLQPVLRGEAEVVYGTRSFGSHTAYSFWYVLGNKGVTMFANVVYDCWISDLETCFKLLPLPLYRELDIRSAGFGMEAEVTGKLLVRGYRPYEVPISYKARSREEGKKLTWKDGVEALWILTRERVKGRDHRRALSAS
jgi:dolichol-phosphate hexosyltransferase